MSEAGRTFPAKQIGRLKDSFASGQNYLNTASVFECTVAIIRKINSFLGSVGFLVARYKCKVFLWYKMNVSSGKSHSNYSESSVHDQFVQSCRCHIIYFGAVLWPSTLL